MSKEHFPVNDKTIADVNAANARAYDADVPTKHQKKIEAQNAKMPAPMREVMNMSKYDTEAALKIAGRKSGDHVRESKQEHGEAHDASKAETKKAAAHTGVEPHKFQGPGNTICQSANCGHTKNHPIHVK